MNQHFNDQIEEFLSEYLSPDVLAEREEAGTVSQSVEAAIYPVRLLNPSSKRGSIYLGQVCTI